MPALAPDVLLLVAACRKMHPDDRVPVWFMRQAGRSLPEYRASREGIGMLESCMRPELVAEITYLTCTADGLLRHTVYVGLREDKPADQVR